MLFLAGFALVNLRSMQDESATSAKEDLLFASSWRLEALGETRVPGETRIVQSFGPDGAVTGFTGCNNLKSI